MLRCSLMLLALAINLAASESNRFSLFRSEDRGRTWSKSDTGLPGDARINALTTSQEFTIAGVDAGIFASADSGKTWQKAAFAGTAFSRVVALAAINQHVFAGADGRVLLVSTNSGRDWRTNETFPRQIVRSLLAVEGVLYVGTDDAGAFRSADLGKTWTHISAGLPPNAQILALTSIKSQVFAGLYARGLYTLRDDTWARVGVDQKIEPLALAAVGETIIAGHNPGGIYLGANRGATWKPWSGEAGAGGPALFADFQIGARGVALDAPIWELGSDHEIAFAGAADGIFFSEDLGQSWTRAIHGLPTVSPGVAFLVRSNVVLAATLSNYKTHALSKAAK